MQVDISHDSYGVWSRYHRHHHIHSRLGKMERIGLSHPATWTSWQSWRVSFRVKHWSLRVHIPFHLLSNILKSQPPSIPHLPHCTIVNTIDLSLSRLRQPDGTP
jgi:hypothetical protein